MRCSLLLVLLTACATVPKGPPPVPPSERSSLSAVLAHADELKLSPLQVARLSQFDQAREVKASEVRAEFRARAEGKGPPVGAMSGNPNDPNAGMGNSGPGGLGGMDASGQNSMGTPGQGRQTRRSKEAMQEALESRIDEIDTQAYFLAEPFLDEAQKALAQKYASAYRLALYNYRDAMKAR